MFCLAWQQLAVDQAEASRLQPCPALHACAVELLDRLASPVSVPSYAPFLSRNTVSYATRLCCACLLLQLWAGPVSTVNR